MGKSEKSVKYGKIEKSSKIWEIGQNCEYSENRWNSLDFWKIKENRGNMGKKGKYRKKGRFVRVLLGISVRPPAINPYGTKTYENMT